MREKISEMDANNWKPYCEKVKKTEDAYRSKEPTIDGTLDSIVISFESDDSNSDSDSE